MGEFTHINKSGRPRMVDVSGKDITKREAVACGEIFMAPSTLRKIKAKDMKKGDVLAAAGRDIDFDVKDDRIEITAILSTTGKTGIEMEALTAVSVAALTLYDMCKSVDKTMKIQNIRLLSKKGGQSGDWIRNK